MRLAFFQARKTISLSAPRVLSQIALVLVGVILLSATALSQQVADASLSGTVRSINADPVQNVVIRLQPQDSSKSFTAQTDTQGKYKFSSLADGVYQLSASKSGFQDASIPSVFLGKKEEKTLDLTLGLSKSPEGVAASNQPQFFDEPQFTVAGVTDTTSLGGHGSDTVVRTRENLAKDTMSLGKPSVVASNSADATEKSLREQAERTPSSFDTNHRLGELLVANGKGTDAVPFLERAAKAQPGDYKNSYDLALANFDAGNYASARDGAKGLIGANDKAGALHHLLADAKKSSEIPSTQSANTSAQPKSIPKRLTRSIGAWSSCFTTPPNRRCRCLRKALVFPSSVRMLIGLGAALFARGSYDAAVRKISEASDLDPNDSSPYIFLGRMQSVDAVSSREISEKLHRFVTLHPESAQANYYYAIALGKAPKGQPGEHVSSEAESFLKKAVDQIPSLPPTCNWESSTPTAEIMPPRYPTFKRLSRSTPSSERRTTVWRRRTVRRAMQLARKRN